jgi:hypothetical protein
MGSREGETSYQPTEEIVTTHEEREAKEGQEREAKRMEEALSATRSSTSTPVLLGQEFFEHMERMAEDRAANLAQQNEFFSRLIRENNGGIRNGGPKGVSLTEFLQTNPLTFATAPEPMDADDWLRDTERKLKTVRCNDEEKVRYATYLLSGLAASWWDNMILIQPSGHVFTWDEFKKKFREAQVPESIMELKRREFETLKQNDLSVWKYLVEFDRLSRYAAEDVNTEEKRIKRFLKGMNPFLKMQLNLTKCTRFHELVDTAITLENDYEEVQNERKRKARLEPQPIQIQQTQSEMNFQTRDETITPFYSQVRCHNCARKGHYAKDCTQQDITCFGCGQLGHMKSECPDPYLVRRSNEAMNQFSNHRGSSSSKKFEQGSGWSTRTDA